MAHVIREIILKKLNLDFLKIFLFKYIRNSAVSLIMVIIDYMHSLFTSLFLNTV